MRGERREREKERERERERLFERERRKAVAKEFLPLSLSLFVCVCVFFPLLTQSLSLTEHLMPMLRSSSSSNTLLHRSPLHPLVPALPLNSTDSLSPLSTPHASCLSHLHTHTHTHTYTLHVQLHTPRSASHAHTLQLPSSLLPSPRSPCIDRLHPGRFFRAHGLIPHTLRQLVEQGHLASESAMQLRGAHARLLSAMRTAQGREQDWLNKARDLFSELEVGATASPRCTVVDHQGPLPLNTRPLGSAEPLL